MEEAGVAVGVVVAVAVAGALPLLQPGPLRLRNFRKKVRLQCLVCCIVGSSPFLRAQEQAEVAVLALGRAPGMAQQQPSCSRSYRKMQPRVRLVLHRMDRWHS